MRSRPHEGGLLCVVATLTTWSCSIAATLESARSLASCAPESLAEKPLRTLPKRCAVVTPFCAASLPTEAPFFSVTMYWPAIPEPGAAMATDTRGAATTAPAGVAVRTSGAAAATAIRHFVARILITYLLDSRGAAARNRHSQIRTSQRFQLHLEFTVNFS